MPVRVLIADDQPLVRAGLRLLLSTASDIQVVGEAANGEEAKALVESLTPDVVLMDVRMPGTDGLQAANVILSTPRLAGVRVVMLTTFDVDEYVFEALEMGASGFLLKDAEPEEIVRAIRAAAAGDAVLSPTVARRLIADYARRPRRSLTDTRALDALTDREREVMVLVSRGLSNEEIGAQLFMSRLTAKTHVSRILTKLSARDRAQLVMLAYELGLVEPGESRQGDDR
jgi:DNA-binding NarL/FixJ family response regulator